jgi:transposase InsO family protein
MDAHRGEFRIGTMCEVLGVSRSGYYAWRRRPRSLREETNAKLTETIRVIHEESRRIYGSPRIYAALQHRGIACGRHRVARLMRDEGIRSKTKRRFRSIATKRAETPAAPNRLERRFTAARPNRVWASDITIVKTAQGWLHLAIVLDLCSRKVVGWATSTAVTQTLALEALQRAFTVRRPKPGLLHHSDRGGQYLSAAYQHLLDEHGAHCSMSRPGNCLDNAAVESFFHTLKTELVHHRQYATRAEATRDIFAYIEGFYNRTRRHSAIGYISPIEMELKAA